MIDLSGIGETVHGIPGEWAALGSALLWACTSILFTTAGRSVSPVATNLFKTVAATLLFGTVLLFRDGLPFDADLSARQIGLLALSGVLGLTLGDSFLFLGYQILGTRRAMLVQSLHPVLGALLAIAIFQETLGPRGWGGMALALAGIGLVIGDRIGALPPEHRSSVKRGVVFCLIAACGQALGALTAKAALGGADAFGATQVRVATGAVGLVIYATVRGQLRGWARGLARPPVLWRLSIASVLGPFLAIWFMLYALQNTPAGVVLTLLSMGPIWLLPLGALLQKDIPSGREILGAMTAIGGIALLLWQ